MIIRNEKTSDHKAVFELIQEAFLGAQHSDGTEHNLVENLRKGRSFVAELSLVAEENDEIVGHVLFTEGKVGEEVVLVLAPLSVKPSYQRRGIGKALVKRGHEIARTLGYGYAFVLGSEHYYPKFGYVPASTFGIEVPEGFPDINFMVIKLRDDAPQLEGILVYPEEFGI